MKVLLKIITYVLVMIGVAVFTLFTGFILTLIQITIFESNDYIVRSVHDSAIRMTFIFEAVYVLGIFVYFERNDLYKSFYLYIKKNTGKIVAIALTSIIFMVYYFVTNFSIVTADSIIHHTFFNPLGEVYLYSDIKRIDTGIYGENFSFFSSKGEFYYNIQLKNEAEFNLLNVAMIKDNKDIYDVILDLDKVFVKSGINKTVNDKNFDLCKERLDKIYWQKIESVFNNQEP